MVEWIWFIDYGLENKPKIKRKIFGNLANNFGVDKRPWSFRASRRCSSMPRILMKLLLKKFTKSCRPCNFQPVKNEDHFQAVIKSLGWFWVHGSSDQDRGAWVVMVVTCLDSIVGIVQVRGILNCLYHCALVIPLWRVRMIFLPLPMKLPDSFTYT